MAGCCGDTSDIDGENEMETFGNMDATNGIKKDRTCTDKYPLIGMACFFSVLAVLLIVCISNGDIQRLINGYDDCGNVCGKINKKTPATKQFQCFGKDMSEKRYLLIKTVNNVTVEECVKDCKNSEGYIEILNRCIGGPVEQSPDGTVRSKPRDFFMDVADDLQVCWKEIIFLSFLALVFSIILLFLMRYAAGFVVWFVLLGIMLLCIAGTIYLWILYKNSNGLSEENQSEILIAACVVSFFSVIIILVILVMFKKIKLVIQLFKEAAKSIAAIPQVLLQPVITFLALFCVMVCGLYFTMWIASYGDLVRKVDLQDTQYMYRLKDNPEKLVYTINMVAAITSWYNYVAMLWIIQFIIGCQHMIVAGCIATWFFARNKNELGSPLVTSATNLLKYHLGTVAFGSLIITIVQVVKAIIRSLLESSKKNNSIIACVMDFCLRYVLEWIEAILKYFSRNAYIQTAIYGIPFCQAGKKAFKLLTRNCFTMAAINSVGDFVLFFEKIFIVLATVLIGFEMLREKEGVHYVAVPLILIGVIAYFIAHCFVTIFEMAIDTIFLCFCEDYEQNDGISRPYFMSRGLMEFVENSNKVLNKNWEQDRIAWENGPKKYMPLVA